MADTILKAEDTSSKLGGLQDGLAGAATFVSILVPALNEEAYIEQAIRTIAPRSPELDYEIIVLDGGSGDRTTDIVRALARADSRIRLVENPQRLQSAAVNLGAKIANPNAQILIRADCHATYPAGFADRLVAALETVDAVSIVVPMKTIGDSCFQRGVAAAQNSRLGNGGSQHRKGGASSYVEHGHHAAFRRSFFDIVGGYDETFSNNEDAELDYRISRRGGRIWFAGDLGVGYFPRGTLRGLARQYFNHGAGRARTRFKHKQPLKLRQLIPVGATISMGVGVLCSPFFPLGLVVPSLYAMACIAAGLAVAWENRSWCAAFSGPAASVMHVSWGIGFLWATAKCLARPDLHSGPMPVGTAT
jgi:succinoglycan biosynthesis protein ExoA